MTRWLRSKIIGQLVNTPVHNLCTFARRQMAKRVMCRKEDYPNENEVNETVSENFASAPSKINATVN